MPLLAPSESFGRLAAKSRRNGSALPRYIAIFNYTWKKNTRRASKNALPDIDDEKDARIDHGKEIEMPSTGT